MTGLTARATLAILVAAGAASGCGLKGALTMPSKSDEVVIRTPGQAAAAAEDTPTAPAAAGESPPAETPVAQPPAGPAQPAPAKKKDERLPPPPLPGGNPGTARGG